MLRNFLAAVTLATTLVIGAPAAHASSDNAPTWWIGGTGTTTTHDFSWWVHWEKMNVWSVDLEARGPNGAFYTRTWDFGGRQAYGDLEGTEQLSDGYWDVTIALRMPNGDLIHLAHRGVLTSGSGGCFGEWLTCP
jgi:hypothetical protein